MATKDYASNTINTDVTNFNVRLSSVDDNVQKALVTLDELSVVAKTSAYTASATDNVITCGAGNETFTVDLPTPVSGKVYYIKNVGTGIVTVDADTTGSTTLDGETSQAMNQHECMQIFSDGSAYWII